MATKLFLRPSHSSLSPLFSLFPSKTPKTHKTLSLSLSLSLSSPSGTHFYGPSLLKGTSPPTPKPLDPEEDDGNPDYALDEARFARVFEIAAIRVPSKDCAALESRLRGHLLNWPRIRNIARVPGDDIDDSELAGLLAGPAGADPATAASRRLHGRAEGDGEALSPVLRRDEVARKFDSRGFVRFRNLAKISRPKKRKKREGREGEKGIGRREMAMVEVVDEGEEREDGNVEDLKGLLGEEFAGRGEWRGPTRLLLLDERCSTECPSQLPEAIKVILNENTTSAHELVKCRLTLFYDYWQMYEILEAMLPEGITVPSAFETVGHIAHLNLRDEHLPYKKLIAKVVLDKNKPKIQTVVNKVDAIQNDYRTMELEVLAGNRSLVTTVVENGLRFHVDLASVYWNSRLATERQRLLNGFTRSDVVCDVFAGVGPIAISAARIVKRVYANDLNPLAIDYLERNTVLNKLEKKIKVFNMDGRRFIISMFQSDKAPSITQVVMNLPNDAAEFLDAFRGVLRGRTQEREFPMPTIHAYGFSRARDPEFDYHERIRIALSEAAVNVEMRRVRHVAPGKWMLCASFSLPKSVAFAKPILNM